MSATCEHGSLLGASSRRPRGRARPLESIKPILLCDMFRCQAASLGGCVQFQITNLERICDRVIPRRPLCVEIEGLKATEPNPAW